MSFTGPLTSFSPNVGDARKSTLHFPTKTATLITLTTAGGVVTLTAAQLLTGLLTCDCQDAQTMTTPTAALIVAAFNGPMVGLSFDVDVINYGATTLTIGLGTGVTKATIAGVSSVLTLVTLAAKRLTFVLTNVTAGSEAVSVYAFGSTAAAVA
jgi:hypothetical protein